VREWRNLSNRRFRQSFHFERLSRFGLVGRGNTACAAEHRSSGCPDKDLAKDRRQDVAKVLRELDHRCDLRTKLQEIWSRG
jgi:hypothetical protein